MAKGLFGNSDFIYKPARALTDPLVIARIVRPVEYKTDKRPFPRSHRVSSGGQIVVNRRLDAVLAQISPRGQ